MGQGQGQLLETNVASGIRSQTKRKITSFNIRHHLLVGPIYLLLDYRALCVLLESFINWMSGTGTVRRLRTENNVFSSVISISFFFFFYSPSPLGKKDFLIFVPPKLHSTCPILAFRKRLPTD